MITKKESSKLLFFLGKPGDIVPLVKLFKYLYIFDMYCQENFGMKSKEKYFSSEICPIPINIWKNIISGEFQKKFAKDISIFSYPGNKKIAVPNLRWLNAMLLPDHTLKFFDDEFKKKTEIRTMNNVITFYKDLVPSIMHEKIMLQKSYWRRFIEMGALGEDKIINDAIPIKGENN